MPEFHCVMLGLGGPTFITDWAKAVSRFARVTGLSVVPRLPDDAVPLGRDVGIKHVDGFETVFVHRRRFRPVRFFWPINARIQAAEMERALALAEWSPTILHGHFFAGAASLPGLAERLNIPFVLTEHTSRLADKRPDLLLSKQGVDIMKHVFAAAAAVFFVGPEQMRSARHLGAAGNFDVIANPVDTTIFEPGPPVAANRIATVGHLLPRKRHDLLLRAFRPVAAERPDARLDIMGGGTERSRLEALAFDLGIAQQTVFHGHTDRSTIARTLREANLYVHTSERESFGVAPIEALLSGTPAVVIRSGGVTEELDPSVGIMVDDDDADGLSRIITTALDSPSFAEPAAIAAWAEARYGPEHVARRVRHHYDQILVPG